MISYIGRDGINYPATDVNINKVGQYIQVVDQAWRLIHRYVK